MIENNSLVLVRTFSAGVHYGTLIERNGREVSLASARRIWYWKGALSLNEIASIGLDLASSKISAPVDKIDLTEAIEVISISSKSNLPL